jgi:hypothetical protein
VQVSDLGHFPPPDGWTHAQPIIPQLFKARLVTATRQALTPRSSGLADASRALLVKENERVEVEHTALPEQVRHRRVGV